MNKLTEKAAYVKGLADGMNISEKGEQGKIIMAIIDLLGEMASGIEESNEAISMLEETVDTLSDDMADLEEAVYEIEDEDVKEADEDDDFVEFQCPHCGDTIYYDVDIIESEDDLICPSCNKPVVVVSADEEE